MEQDEIIKGNRIIAEFMGFDYTQDYVTEHPHSIGEHEFDRPMTEKDLEYHSNWSWLMPVFGKIDETIIPAQTFRGWNYPEKPTWCIYGRNAYITIGDNFLIINPTGVVRPKEPLHVEKESAIVAAWNTVLHFISWYNTNLTQPRKV